MKFFRNLSATILALVMLLTIAGQAMSLHFCGGKFQTIGISGISSSCHQAVKLPPCHQQPSGEEHATDQHGCCENQTVITEHLDLQNQVFSKVNFQKAFVYVAIALPSCFGIQLLARVEIIEKPFAVPRIVPDRMILFQSFLL